MTGQELIDWIKAHHAENMVVEMACRDDGGPYYGTDEVYPEIIKKGKNTQFIPSADYDRLIL